MQVTLKLDASARRPVVKLDWFNGCRALVDTGALFPVWTASEKILSHKLGAKLEKSDISFSGFGGNVSGTLYRVNFKLSHLLFLDMPIIATNMDSLNCHLILPATMFDKMIYEIDTINHALNIDTKDNQLVRILRLSDDNGKISVYLAGTYERVEDYYRTDYEPTDEEVNANYIHSLLEKDKIQGKN